MTTNHQSNSLASKNQIPAKQTKKNKIPIRSFTLPQTSLPWEKKAQEKAIKQTKTPFLQFEHQNSISTSRRIPVYREEKKVPCPTPTKRLTPSVRIENTDGEIQIDFQGPKTNSNQAFSISLFPWLFAADDDFSGQFLA